MRNKQRPRTEQFKTFKVQLHETRTLTCYIDAESKAAAVRASTQTWALREVNPARELPFEITAAKLKQPVRAHLVAAVKQRQRAGR